MKRIFAIITLCFGCGSVNPITVTASPMTGSLDWTATVSYDANIEPDLAGYNIYYGKRSSAYDKKVDVGNKTSVVINSLEDGETYFFAVTAYDVSGNESLFSAEVSTHLGVTVSLKPFLSWRVAVGDTNIIEIDSTKTKMANLDLSVVIKHYEKTPIDSVRFNINDTSFTPWAIVGEGIFFKSNGIWVTNDQNVIILSGFLYGINVQVYHDNVWSEWAEPSKRFKINVVDAEDELITETIKISVGVKIE